MAVETKPRPAIPETARESFFEAAAIQKTAKDVTGQRLAIASFEKALLIAPWWGDAYYNLSVVQETVGDFDKAQASLKFYILTAPGEKEAREAQDRIYAIGGKKKIAEAEARAKADRDEQSRREREAAAEAERRRQNDVDLTGTWGYECCAGWIVTFTPTGTGEFIMRHNNRERLRFTLSGRSFEGYESGSRYKVKGYVNAGNQRIDFSYFNNGWVNVPIVRK